jgi:EAL domain-containing protein (putative c-di-GMP-specific phosphodiesterase class I)/GGDEF domain-containing protein/CheY-like chemotaxis protein
MGSESPSDTLHVLLATRDARFREDVLARLAGTGLQVVPVDSPEALAREASAHSCALALVDARAEHGLEWCRSIPRNQELPLLPLIALIAGSESARARSAGATDWTHPESDGATIADRVRSALAQHSAQVELVHLRQVLERGPWTGRGDTQPSLPDREQFLEQMERLFARAQPPHDALVVMSLNLDLERALLRAPSARPFVLACTAQRIKHCIRDRDMLGALSARASDVSLAHIEDVQFALLLPGLVRPHDAYKVARRLQEALSAPLAYDNAELEFRCSIGLSLSGHDGQEPGILLQAAQDAERLARAEERGGVRFHTHSMNATALERLALESSLRAALEQRQLCLYYQPKIDIATGAITGFEALARWNHPELGMVSPCQFIPVAEETGLIVPLSEFALEEACREARRWRDEGLPPVRVAVNISGVHLAAGNLNELVRDTLERTGLPADALELELTESILLQKTDIAVARLRGLKEMGVHLSIDDFGTGYSSLSYLKRFPVDTLKIDQSFVREVTTDPEDAAITTSIILMGKSLKLKIVAEGVETESQLQFLRVLECDEAQGFLFGHPMPPAEARAMLARPVASRA